MSRPDASPQEFTHAPVTLVDLQLPFEKIFPGLLTRFDAETLQKAYDNHFQNVVATPNLLDNHKWTLEFRSTDANRYIHEIGNTHLFLTNMNRQTAYNTLNAQYRRYQRRSQTLIYDTVLDKPQEFQTSGDISPYIAALEDMLADEGIVVLQLSDKSDVTANEKVTQLLQTRFGTPTIRRYTTKDKYPLTGALYIYKKGDDMFTKPTDITDEEKGILDGEDMVTLAQQILTAQRLVEVSKG